jgi:hypothetical protein
MQQGAFRPFSADAADAADEAPSADAVPPITPDPQGSSVPGGTMARWQRAPFGTSTAGGSLPNG